MKKIGTSIASMALIANIFLPTAVLAGSTELEITGNGSGSDNNTAVTQTNNTVVSQTNSANITNTVNANSNTGSNKASKNTGGDVSIDTGNSKTLVSIENAANSNTADVTNCNCDADASVKISGNGADTKNNAALSLTDSNIVYQNNDANIKNKVNADSNSGDNKANRNTGGNVEVSTGHAVTFVDLSTHANSNAAQVGGSHGNAGSDVSLTIAGNGADSKNDILLALDRDVLLQQNNSSSVNNYVDATSSTGDNKANRNTGGGTLIDTGNAYTEVAVDNAANFNWANIDCDCLTNVSAKVAGNGADTDNHIKALLSNDQNVFQDNSCGTTSALVWGWDGFNKGHKCGINNNLTADSETGDNHAKSNTGDPSVDPEIWTGDSQTVVEADNSGNSNVFGAPAEGDWHGINISFDLNDLWSAIGIH